jgi:hypothetical protein
MSNTPDLRYVEILGKKNFSGKLPNDLVDAIFEAREFLTYYKWVSSIDEEYLGVAFSGILYLFLFKITSNRADVDPWVWVVVGDLPPAYLTCDDAHTPYEALDSYIGAMQEWVAAAKVGKSVANLIPVNIPATLENALFLENRLKLIDERILPELN